MYWLIDVFVILLLIVSIVRGIKKGFFNTSFDFFGYFIALALALVLTALFGMLCYKFGLIDEMTIGWVKILGETNGLFKMLNVTSEQIAYYISLAIVGLVCFAISYVIMLLLFKAFQKLMANCRENLVFRIIDSILGFLINTVLSVALILAVFAVINAFSANSFVSSLDEAINACPLSRYIYQYNPLNSILTGLISPAV